MFFFVDISDDNMANVSAINNLFRDLHLTGVDNDLIFFSINVGFFICATALVIVVALLSAVYCSVKSVHRDISYKDFRTPIVVPKMAEDFLHVTV